MDTNPTTPSPTEKQPVNKEPTPNIVIKAAPPSFFSSLKKKITPNVITALVALLIMGGVFAGTYLTKENKDIRARADNTGPTLSFIPGQKTIGVGGKATLAVQLSTNADTISAVQLDFSYDKEAIDEITFTPGTILPVVLKPVNSTDGRITVTLGSQPTSPYRGTGIVGTLSIRGKTESTSYIRLTPQTITASIGKTSNSLLSADKIKITVGSNSGSTATPTVATQSPTPTLTPAPTTTKTKTSSTRTTTSRSTSPTATPAPQTSVTITPTMTPSATAVQNVSPTSINNQ